MAGLIPDNKGYYVKLIKLDKNSAYAKIYGYPITYLQYKTNPEINKGKLKSSHTHRSFPETTYFLIHPDHTYAQNLFEKCF